MESMDPEEWRHEYWEHNPDDVVYKYYDNISIDNMWKNKESEAVIVQFTTITTVKANKYAEFFETPEAYDTWYRRIKEKLTSSNLEDIKKVTPTGGFGFSKRRSRREVLEDIYEYMENDPKGEEPPSTNYF